MSMKAIILGAERGVRRLESAKSYPLTLLEDSEGRRVLDWILAALADVGIDDIIFVGGYHLEKLVKDYPQLHYFYNQDWNRTGSLYSLFCAESKFTGNLFVIQANVVFHSEVLKHLIKVDGDIVIGAYIEESIINKKYKPSNIHTDKYDISSYAGLFKVNSRGVELIKNEYHKGDFRTSKAAKVSELLWKLYDKETNVKMSMITSGWARIDSALNFASFVMGSKGQTLERLKPIMTQAIILDQVRFTVKEWHDTSEGVLERIKTYFPSGYLVVRSCALNEDSWTESHAGKFRTELGLDAGDEQSIMSAIDSVIASYEENGIENNQNEVFVQSYLTNTIFSGVLFTRHHETGAPIIVVNYDDTTRSTDTVTSGQGKNLRTAIIYKHNIQTNVQNRYISQLLKVVFEIEHLLGHDSLDIEFAFDDLDNCYLLQVRVLVGGKKDFKIEDVDVYEEIEETKKCVNGLLNHRLFLQGARTIFANMPDWNPAEIIGVSPRPLAYSLFQHIITDRIWGKAREAIGYRDTHPEPLVVLLAGHPYVDVRTSLNSFLPSGLSQELSEKLVNHSLEWLESNPEFHDKFEFEVALTCLDFDFERHRNRLLENGFSDEEVNAIHKALFSLTDGIICGKTTTIEKQMRLIDQLCSKRKRALSANHDSLVSLIRMVDCLLDDCKRYGTLPFSILARYAFIATSFLKSLHARGIFSSEEKDQLLRSMPAVTTRIYNDLQLLHKGFTTLETFLTNYGHLRPGTYDITSPSYAEAPDVYFSNLDVASTIDDRKYTQENAINLFDKKSLEISALIRETGFTFSVTELRDFILASIPARENSKFEYTKNINAALSLISEIGSQVGLSKDEMSFMPIKYLLELSTNSPSNALEKEWKRTVTFNRKRYLIQKAIILPHMITNVGDIDYFELLRCRPNYITSKRVTAPVVDVNKINEGVMLVGKIAFIESADPGYDWIFGHGICGLITKYGGVASHMSIRAAELSLPAAIGCGELIGNQVLEAQLIELDCAGQNIRVLR